MINIPVFDGHNDLLLALWRSNDLKGESFISGRKNGHIDLLKCKKGGFCGGFFAIFVPAISVAPENFWQRYPELIDHKTKEKEIRNNLLNTEAISQPYAYAATIEMMNIAHQMANHNSEELEICTNYTEIKRCIDKQKIAMLLHVEGAEAISSNLAQLELLYEKGLRSIGPVWSRKNVFAEGVNFDFPSTPNQGDGLTDVGRELIRFCNSKKILIDLSHLNEKGFWEVAKISDKPLVATHSNVHALCPSPRNLTSSQLSAIAETNGVVGLNFGIAFLHSEGKQDKNLHPDTMCTHLDSLLKILGEDGVAFGSDFDGIRVSNHISDCSGLPILVNSMRERGYGETLIEKICFKNWLRLLEKTIG